MLKRANRAFLSLILFFLFFALFHRADTAAEQRNFLWKAQAENNAVYILGSIHFARKEMYPLNSDIETAFDDSDILVVELDIDQVDKKTLQKRMLENTTYPHGETLKATISRKTYDMARERFRDFSIRIEEFNQTKPPFVAMLLTVLEFQRLGFDPNIGIDKYFLDKARGRKQIMELENFDYQIDLFNSFSRKEEELFLLYTLIEFELIEEFLDKLVYAWKTGDAQTVESFLTRNIVEYPDLMPIYEKLYHDRNRKMLTKIEGFLKTDKNYFVVIGAGHLVGEKGIIKLLKQKGYRIEQL